MYEIVAELEEQVGRQVDLVLQVGDLGVWPFSDRLDRATRNHGGAGEFSRWWKERKAAPRPTIFIPGNHEDFSHLLAEGGGELLPNLVFLPWGEVVTYVAGEESLRIGGVGGCYGPSDYDKSQLFGPARRHYTHSELQRLVRESEEADIDILLFHDAPAGPVHDMRCTEGRPFGRTSQSAGLGECVARVSPRICLTGHMHFRTERWVGGVCTVGLNAVPYPGSVLLLELLPGEPPPRFVAEHGGPPEGTASPSVQAGPWTDSGEGLVKELEAVLESWAQDSLGNGNLDKRTRRRFHEQLLGHPHRKLLATALGGHRLRDHLERLILPAERAGLLETWQEGGLPKLRRN